MESPGQAVSLRLWAHILNTSEPQGEHSIRALSTALPVKRRRGKGSSVRKHRASPTKAVTHHPSVPLAPATYQELSVMQEMCKCVNGVHEDHPEKCSSTPTYGFKQAK